MRLPCSASSRLAGCAEDCAPAYSHHRARGIRKIEEALHKQTTGSMVTVTEIHTRKTQICGADLSSKHHMSPKQVQGPLQDPFHVPRSTQAPCPRSGPLHDHHDEFALHGSKTWGDLISQITHAKQLVESKTETCSCFSRLSTKLATTCIEVTQKKVEER